MWYIYSVQKEDYLDWSFETHEAAFQYMVKKNINIAWHEIHFYPNGD